MKIHPEIQKFHSSECERRSKQLISLNAAELEAHEKRLFGSVKNQDSAELVLNAYHVKAISPLAAYWRLRSIEVHQNLDVSYAYYYLIDDDCLIAKFKVLAHHDSLSESSLEKTCMNIITVAKARFNITIRPDLLRAETLVQDIQSICRGDNEDLINELRLMRNAIRYDGLWFTFFSAIGRNETKLDQYWYLNSVTEGYLFSFKPSLIFEAIKLVTNGSKQVGDYLSLVVSNCASWMPNEKSGPIIKGIVNEMLQRTMPNNDLLCFFLAKLYGYGLETVLDDAERKAISKQLRLRDQVALELYKSSGEKARRTWQAHQQRLIEMNINSLSDPDSLSTYFHELLILSSTHVRESLPFKQLLNAWGQRIEGLVKSKSQKDATDFISHLMEQIPVRVECKALIQYRARSQRYELGTRSLRRIAAEFYIRQNMTDALYRLIAESKIFPNLHSVIVYDSFGIVPDATPSLVLYAIRQRAIASVELLTQSERMKAVSLVPSYLKLRNETNHIIPELPKRKFKSYEIDEFIRLVEQKNPTDIQKNVNELLQANTAGKISDQTLIELLTYHAYLALQNQLENIKWVKLALLRLSQRNKLARFLLITFSPLDEVEDSFQTALNGITIASKKALSIDTPYEWTMENLLADLHSLFNSNLSDEEFTLLSITLSTTKIMDFSAMMNRLKVSFNSHCFHNKIDLLVQGMHPPVPASDLLSYVDRNQAEMIAYAKTAKIVDVNTILFHLLEQSEFFFRPQVVLSKHPVVVAFINRLKAVGKDTLFHNGYLNTHPRYDGARLERLDGKLNLPTWMCQDIDWPYDALSTLRFWMNLTMDEEYIESVLDACIESSDQNSITIRLRFWKSLETGSVNPIRLLVESFNEHIPESWLIEQADNEHLTLTPSESLLRPDLLPSDLLAIILCKNEKNILEDYVRKVNWIPNAQDAKSFYQIVSQFVKLQEFLEIETNKQGEPALYEVIMEAIEVLFAAPIPQVIFPRLTIPNMGIDGNLPMLSIFLDFESRLLLRYSVYRESLNLPPSRQLKCISENQAEFYIEQNDPNKLATLLSEISSYPCLRNQVLFGQLNVSNTTRSTLLAHAIYHGHQSCVDILTKELGIAEIPLAQAAPQTSLPVEQAPVSDVEQLCQYLDKTLSQTTGFKLSSRREPSKRNQVVELIYTHNTAANSLTNALVSQLKTAFSNVFSAKKKSHKGQIYQQTRKGAIECIVITIQADYMNDWLQILSNKKLQGILSAIYRNHDTPVNSTNGTVTTQASLSEGDLRLIHHRMQLIAIGLPYTVIESNASQIIIEVDYQQAVPGQATLSKDKLKSLRQRLKRLGVEVTAENGINRFCFKAVGDHQDKTLFNDDDWSSTGAWLEQFKPVTKAKKAAPAVQMRVEVAKPAELVEEVMEAAKPDVADVGRDEIDYADLVKSMLAQLIPQAYYPALLTYFQFPDEIRLFKDKFIPLAVKPGVQNVRIGDYGFPIAQCLQFLAKQGLIFYLNSPCLQLSFEKNCLAILSQEQETLHAQFQDWIAQYKIEYQHYPRATIFKQKAKVITQLDKIDKLIHDNRAELKENGFFDLLEELKYCDLKIEHAINEESKREKTFLQCHYKAYGYYLTMVIQRLFDVVGEHSNDALSALRHTVRHMRYDSHDLISLRSNTRAILKVINEKITKPEIAAFKQTLERYQDANQQQTISRNEALSIIQSEFAFIEEVKALPVKDSEKLCIKASLCHSANLIHQLMKAHRLYGQVSKHIKDEIQKISQEIGHSAISPHLTMQ